MDDRCYSCDYYDELIEQETGEPYPFCNKPYNVAYPKNCPESKDVENDRKDCPYRHINGNCLPIGGFCLSVDDKYCKFKQEHLKGVENAGGG